MNIGLFTDTYFPQVSGVATSIKTLRNELTRQGHQVYIFTTTDPHVAKDAKEENIFRFSSIPFVSFTDRRIAFRGLFQAYEIAKELHLDIVHTQTEFSMGMIGKFVARNLNIPCVHTYHTMYEDYLHYVANGKLLKPIHVKEGTLAFCHNMAGVIAPSNRVLDTLTNYGVKSEFRIIPTGIDIGLFSGKSDVDIRQNYNLKADTPIMLSVSRLAYEKNITAVISAFSTILQQVPNAVLMIVGDGPAVDDLKQQVVDKKLEQKVIFTGEISNDKVNAFYQGADVFVSASESESQGLTYIEAMAAGVPVVVKSSPYTDDLINADSLGQTYADKDQFISNTVHYLKEPVDATDPKVKKVLQKKIDAISATTFANRVTDFYRELQINQELAEAKKPVDITED
ncbi:glycosyltransferase family 4 protein [Lentilactobacillus senioris]|uniref:glycosyltransferase family 4 protein n=1 Tax=Lentilactobacillus senioris TaxID=931534 RepID=UPI00228130EC|nr:glycosyltransferase family 4 protein [Lentilactobacillus senioris]MCY9806711.1 glycosyltransferase family 4 protein [Lentilactobacillus senioris]